MTLRQLAERALGEGHATPFYLLDLDAIERRFRSMRDAWCAVFEREVELAYSYKTNALTALTRVLRAAGASAEVVCGAELAWALDDGHPPARIYFDGPVKRDEELEQALRAGARLQIDSVDEVAQILEVARLHGLSAARLSARLTVPHADGAMSRFGMLPAELAAAQEALRSAGFAIDGVHVHKGNKASPPDTFAALAARSAPTVRRLQQSHAQVVLDLGGGFPSRISAGARAIAPDQDYALSVRRALIEGGVELGRLHLVLEPGRALTEDHGALVCRVVARKQRDESRVLVVDAPGNLARNSADRPASAYLLAEGEAGHRVYGANCFERDILASNVRGPEVVELGTPLVIEGTGAYELSAAPSWIRPAPAVIAQHRGAISQVRRAQSALDLRARDVR